MDESRAAVRKHLRIDGAKHSNTSMPVHDVGTSSVNLTGILGDAGADSEGLMGKATGRAWEGATLPTRESRFFRLKWRFVHSKRYFCLCPRQQSVELQPEVVIW